MDRIKARLSFGLLAFVLLLLLGMERRAHATPTITQQPVSYTTSAGADAQFMVTASANGCTTPITYQWKFGTLSMQDVPPAITGTKTSLLYFTRSTLAEAGSYRVTVTCPTTGASVTSNTVSLTVGPPVLPVITGQPASMALDPGGDAYFLVFDQAPSPCASLSVQWQRNGINLQDSAHITDSKGGGVFTIHGVTDADAGSYRVVLTCTNTLATATSDTATLTVNRLAAPTVQPPVLGLLSATVISGGQSTLSWIAPVGPSVKLTITPSGGASTDVTGKTSLVVKPTVSTIYTLTATNAGGSFGENTAVVVGPYTAITACGDIAAPGNYQISSNLSTTSTTKACINVHDTRDVFIHCQSSNVTVTGLGTVIDPFGGTQTGGALAFTNVHNFSVDNCTLKQPSSATGGGTFLHFNHSSMGSLTFDTLGEAIVLFEGLQSAKSDYITFFNNSIYNFAEMMRSTGIAFQHNTFSNSYRPTSPGQYLSTAIGFQNGSGNQALDSYIDGNPSGTGNSSDDGITLMDEVGDMIANNNVHHTFDSGIEWVGMIKNTAMVTNQAANTMVGLLGFYNDSLTGSMFIGNHVSGLLDESALGTKSQAFRVTRQCALRNAGYDGDPATPAETHACFNHNLFSGNVIVSNSFMGPSDFMSNISTTENLPCTPNETTLEPSQWIVGDNIFKNNDFGTGVAAPTFDAGNPSMIVDGGGNKCQGPTAPGYPLVCH